jgi:hypothetical protein
VGEEVLVSGSDGDGSEWKLGAAIEVRRGEAEGEYAGRRR